MAKCAYRGENIKRIEEKWIDENVKDEEEKRRRKGLLYSILNRIGDRANCENDAIDGKEFCIFHDPDYWKDHGDEVRNEFLKLLQRSGDKYFVGFHLPDIKLPKVVEGNLHMELAKIHGEFHASTKFQEAWFDGATFEGLAWFDGATFQESASFDWTTFQGLALFFRTTFQGLASFNGATFQGLATFDKATFQEARFNKATFREVLFAWVIFQEAWFIEATFQEARFDDAKFQGLARFDDAKFQGLAQFARTTFQKAWFDRTTFREARFDGAKFIGRATFNDSIVSGSVLFKDSIFLPDFLHNCLDPWNYISFRRIRFEDRGEIVFDGCRMKKVSLIHTDASRIKFRNVDWGEEFRIYDERLFLLKEGKEKSFIKECRRKLKRIRDHLRGKKKDKEIEKEISLDPEISKVLEKIKELRGKKELNEEYKKLAEELEKKWSEKLNELNKELKYLEDKRNLKELKESLIEDDDLKLENVLAVYRSLRDNYDYYLKYEDSGRFFVNEMRLKRRFIGRLSGGSTRKLSDVVEKFVMLFYEAISLYGESYTRPILFLIACIILFSFLRFLGNEGDSTLLEELEKSVYTFFQLYWDGKPLTLIERILSAAILANLYISLRRKLERKIRH